jgi:hypothetical protein
MQAGYYELESDNLIGLQSIYVNDCSFVNSVNTLSAVFECQIIENNIARRNMIKNALIENGEFSVYLTNKSVRYLIMKGILVTKQFSWTNDKYVFNIGITHKTNKMRYVSLRPFEVQNNIANVNAVILDLFKQNNCHKLYDRLIPVREGIIIDNQSYSGVGESVYNVLERILNDVDCSFFTTTIDNNTVLYFYDEGKISLKNKQYINNHNLASYLILINYDKFADNIDLNAQEGIGLSLDMRKPGEAATIKQASKKNLVYNQIDSFGVQKLRRKKNKVDLPEVIFRKTLKTSSNAIDLKEYANLLLRESFNDGIRVECEVVSMFIDINNPLLGTWELGGKIAIENDILRNELKGEFDIYLQNDNKYHFVVKEINTVNANKVKLVLGLSDLLKIK